MTRSSNGYFTLLPLITLIGALSLFGLFNAVGKVPTTFVTNAIAPEKEIVVDRIDAGGDGDGDGDDAEKTERGARHGSPVSRGTVAPDGASTPHTIFVRRPPSLPFPCHPAPAGALHDADAYRRGIQFVKVPKCASSTSAGVALRIARRHAGGSGTCRVQYRHAPPVGDRGYGGRDRERSFLWTIVREPTARWVSSYYHLTLSRKHGKLTAAAADALLREAAVNVRHLRGGKMINALSTAPIGRDRILEMYHKPSGQIRAVAPFRAVVAGILDDYDFIGTVERLDESLVLLQMLLGIDAGDVLYLSAKSSGGYDDGRRGFCALIPKTYVSEETHQFFRSDNWTRANYGDRMLHEAVNRSLDATIAALGADTFRRALDEHFHLLALADEECGGSVAFPCSTTGTLQTKKAEANCYWNDAGCGYPCLDRLVDKWQTQQVGPQERPS